jgi:hypothetical protein
MNSPVAITRRQWLQFPLFFLLSIFGGILSHNVVSYLSTSHKSAHTIRTSSRLEVRDDIRERSSIGDFFNSIGTDFENAVGSLLPNASSILSSLTGGINGSEIVDSLAEPAKFLGVGLADGALTGLNMTIANTTTPSGIDGVAQNLGSGLTSAIFSSSSIKSLLNFNGSSLGSSGTVGQAVLALAQGLGSGAASGLQSSSKVVTLNMTDVMFNTSGINGIAGNFGQGLSSSLLGAVQLPSLSSLMSMGGSALGTGGNSSLNIASIGAGLGAGIGQGAAIGLGFQENVATTSTQDPAGITQDFARGLVSSFLENGTLSAVTKSLSSVSLSGNSSALGRLSLSNIDIAKVAEGLAVGLVSGVGSTISTLQIIDADTTSFNDSVSGAATGFGRGLGTEGGKLVEQLLTSSSSKAASRKRSLDKTRNGATFERSVSLRKRNTLTANATDLASVLANLNASNINPLLQTGINALTCEGVGGLVGVLLGLVQSKTVDLKTLTSTATSTTNNTLNLPDQTFIIKNGGNTYSLNPTKGITRVLINGMGVGSFAGVAAAHSTASALHEEFITDAS